MPTTDATTSVTTAGPPYQVVWAGGGALGAPCSICQNCSRVRGGGGAVGALVVPTLSGSTGDASAPMLTAAATSTISISGSSISLRRDLRPGQRPNGRGIVTLAMSTAVRTRSS